MKKSCFLPLVLVALLCTCLFVVASAESTDGMKFTFNELCRADGPLSLLPSTYEATVYFSEDMEASERGGVIIGNYNGTANCFNFEIHKNGNPRIYIKNQEIIYDVIFNKVNVYTGEWVHIAITKDSEAGVVSCYINGELKQKMSVETPAESVFSTKTAIGGDLRTGNGQYFKGRIKNVALYSDVRTAEEIKSDYAGEELDASALMGYYELLEGEDTFSDKSGVGQSFSMLRPLIKDYESTSDFAYSFAIVGDTQTLTYYYPDKLHYIYDWIVDNAEEKKIKFVFGLGDITDKSTSDEYNLAKAEILKMDGVVPYSIVRGNHDVKGSYKKHFSYKEFKHTITGSYDKSMLNTYQTLTVGEIKYLIVNLDIGPSDRVLEWASRVIEKHRDHNVIITTHIYLEGDGTTVDENESQNATKYGGFNTGEKMWEKLVSKHENIVLVISGHKPTDRIIVTKREGVHGNVVTEMLVDPQGTDSSYKGIGLVAMLYFSEDGRDVDVEYYSTIEKAHFLQENQFEMDLAVVDSASITESHFEGVTKVEKKDPGCVEAGNVEHYVCVCGKLFLDSEATTQISEVEIQPLGHNGEDVLYWSADAHYRYCDRCKNEYDKNPHVDENADEACDVCAFNPQIHEPFAPKIEEPEKESDVSSGSVLPIVIGALCIAAVVAFFIVVLIKKKK